MYDEELLRSRIATQTGYTVTLSQEQSIDLSTTNLSSPRISVGHIGVRLKNPSYLWSDGYSEVENRQVILTNIHILCQRASLTAIRNAVYAAYQNYSPIDNAEYSSVIFIEANVEAVSGNNIHWVEQVGVVYPPVV